ncbi:ETX/MTX2 family pore-forming toxin [Bacillus cereus]|nr:ETX/MTX2 family pore-forming toxin [Bacillus cereus]
MKTKIKLPNKKLMAKSSIIALATSFALISPDLVNADVINLKKGFEQQKQIAADVDPIPVPIENVKGLQDLWLDSKEMKCPLADLIGTAPHNLSNLHFNFLYYKEPSYSVDVIKKNEEKPSSPVYMGTTNLSHSGGTSEQTLYSQAFSKTVTSSVTTTITHGAKVGAKAGAKLQVPLVGETSVELNAEYNFAKAGSETGTENVTYTVPSQPVKLQPGESAKITANLRMAKASGEVRLRTTYTGEIQSNFFVNTPYGPMEDSDTTGLGEWMKTLVDFNEDLKNQWTFSPTYASVAYQDGKGTYNATYGAVLDIHVDIFGGSNKGRKKRDADSTPIRSYSYEVTPEIVENN